MEFTAISRAGASPLPSLPRRSTPASLWPFPWQGRANQPQPLLPTSSPGSPRSHCPPQPRIPWAPLSSPRALSQGSHTQPVTHEHRCRGQAAGGASPALPAQRWAPAGLCTGQGAEESSRQPLPQGSTSQPRDTASCGQHPWVPRAHSSAAPLPARVPWQGTALPPPGVGVLPRHRQAGGACVSARPRGEAGASISAHAELKVQGTHCVSNCVAAAGSPRAVGGCALGATRSTKTPLQGSPMQTKGSQMPRESCFSSLCTMG